MRLDGKCIDDSVMKVLLASNSPRRRELLAMLDVRFEIVQPVEVDESYPSDLPAEDVPAFLSVTKADAYDVKLHDGEVLLTADTVVICDGAILGKPADRDAAVEMLKKLSDNTHTVVTGVSLTTADTRLTFSEHTKVQFAALSDDEITYYVDKYKPYDKAGSYGIQEWIGCVGIKSIDGCFYNVMGLPLHKLYTNLIALDSSCTAKAIDSHR